MPTLTSLRHLEGVRTYGRAADALETVAWRPPSAARFDTLVANDTPTPEPTTGEMMAAMPAWLMVVAGGVVAALTGAMLGGALAI